MKVIWKIGILLILVLAFLYYMDDRVLENELLESPVNHGNPIPVPEAGDGSSMNALARPTKGLSTYVGKDVDVLVEAFGEPDRKEPSGYGFHWWVYRGADRLMAGVKDGVVAQIYSADVAADVTPFQISQSVEEIQRFTIWESEVNVKVDNNIYTFTLNGDDMKNRVLVPYEGVCAQLYIDEVDGELEAVRFIDPVMLVIQQPYDMAYMGNVVTAERPSSTVQMEVDHAMELQIFELTNHYRKKHGFEELIWDEQLDVVASEHSKDMAIENYFSHESPGTGNLANRLKEAEIVHKKAGENIAFNYVDAIEAVHGWLNSTAHRNVLLDKEFTHIGAGAYGRYYTQDMIRRNVEEPEPEQE
ncbi:CAP domain-containing protein [Sporosarcina sp. 179-K 3D1 HS]|uniref:CAP domain-containing protein n=1 Tax=Sporosarcina sp. 179-K 3D1 HS TaxID=3232169 RepID=UPI0039A32922